jgi:hypothetical protein
LFVCFIICVLVRLKNKGKRVLYWSFKEKHTGKYNSYEEFKESWDPNFNIRDEIKKDFKNEFEGIIRIKNVLIWPNKVRRNECREYKRPKEFTSRFYYFFRDNKK